MTTPATMIKAPTNLRRWAIIAIVGFVLINLVVFVVGEDDADADATLASEEQSLDGYYALRQLLVRNAVAVSALTVDLGDLPNGATVILSGPTHTSSSSELTRFVNDGGRVIVFGESELFEALVGSARTPTTDPIPSMRPRTDEPETRGVTTVVGSNLWQVDPSGPARVILANGDEVAATKVDVGSGTLVALADAGALTNRHIGSADNAAFGLAVVGSGPVFFDEVSIVDVPADAAPLPASWRWTFGLLVAAAIVWIVGAARRFGPPEDVDRPLDPSRRDFVDSVAGTLSRASSIEGSAAPLRNFARSQIARMSGLDHSAGAAEIVEAARTLGLSDGHVAALRSSSETPEAAVAAAQLVAEVSRGRVSGT